MVTHPKQLDFGTTDRHDRASVTVSGKRKGNVKVALNSNQVKSLQAGVHADGGGLYLVVRESGDRVWAFRFTDLEGKRAQMEFAKAGDRDSASGDVLTLSSAREKARDHKVALKRAGIDPRQEAGHRSGQQDVQGVCRGAVSCLVPRAVRRGVKAVATLRPGRAEPARQEAPGETSITCRDGQRERCISRL